MINLSGIKTAANRKGWELLAIAEGAGGSHIALNYIEDKNE